MASVLLLPGLAVAVSPFVDVVPGKFYETPVNWAFNNHITTGKDATHFDPNGAVTRGESVTFLKRYDDNIVQPAITGLGNTVGKSLGQLTCGTNQIPKFDGTNWACGNDTAIPDTLAALGCATDQVAHYDGTNWVCNTIGLSYTALPGANTALDTTGNVGWYTSIAIGADNLPIITYWDGTNADLKVVHCTNTACGTHDTPVALDTIGNVGEYTSIAIGADNLPIISYQDVTNGRLKVVHCTNTACGAHNTPTELDTGFVGQYTSIAIGADNLAIISYDDAGFGDLKVVHCTNTACSTHDTPVALDTTGIVGQYTSIAIGADNLPIITYYDSTNGDLKVVHCTNTACSTHDTPAALDTTGNVGRYTSIAIGADNLAIISYLDATNFDLKVVHCTNTACNTHDTPVTIDTTGIVGAFTSIAIGADNLPIISYRDVTNGDLKVAQVNMVLTGITFG